MKSGESMEMSNGESGVCFVAGMACYKSTLSFPSGVQSLQLRVVLSLDLTLNLSAIRKRNFNEDHDFIKTFRIASNQKNLSDGQYLYSCCFKNR